MCRISVRTTLVFTPKVDIPDFLVLFLKKVFPNWGTLAKMGPWPPGGPWGPLGPMGPMGSPWAPIEPMLPHWEKLFSEKVPKNPKCQLWGWKPKLFAPKFCTFWYPYRLVGTLKWQFPGLSFFSPNLEEVVFKTSTNKFWNVHFGVENKVIRTEILHILVPIPSRGDLYLTISRVSTILSKLGFLVQFLVYVFF